MSLKLVDKRLSAEIVKVTPKLALEWLKNNEGNRRLDPHTVLKYADEMDRGDWMLNGETIIRSKTGRLQNGQHRLSAVASGNKSIDMLVVTLASDDILVLATIDTGKPRTNADVLRMKKVENCSRVASIARWLLILDAGKCEGSVAMTSHQAMAILDEHPLASHFGARTSNSRLIVSAMMAPCVLAAEVFGTEVVDGFLDMVVSGTNLSKNDPAFALRERILTGAKGLSRLPAGVKVGLTITALKAHLAGKPLTARGIQPFKPLEGQPIFA